MLIFVRCEKCGQDLGQEKNVEHIPPSKLALILAEYRHNHKHKKNP